MLGIGVGTSPVLASHPVTNTLNTGDFFVSATGTGNGLSAASPMSMTSLQALGGSALSGKTVVVMPGTFSTPTITLSGNAAPITFIPRDPSNLGVFDQLTLNGVGNLTFRGCKFVDSRWDSTSGSTGAAIVPEATCGNLVFDQCTIKGGYRGDTTATIDVLHELPEYACVAAFMTGSSVTSLTIPHAYVGDLLSPGTYPLVMNETGGTGFSATFTVTLTTQNGVTGNFITSTNLINGGTGYSSSLHEARRMTWTGQHRMNDYLPWGWRFFDGATSVASLTVTNGTFSDLGEGMKSAPPLNSLTIIGNHLQRCYGSGFSIGLSSDTVPPSSTVINFNFFDQCGFYDSFDAGNPHGDAVHLFLNDATLPFTPSDWGNIDLSGNVILGHDARNCDIGFLIGQHPGAITFDNPRLVGNLMVGDIANSFIDFDTLRDGLIYRNTGVRFDTTNPSNVTTLALSVPSTSTSTLAYGKSFVSKNISGAITLPNTTNNVIDTGDNVATGLNGATAPYASIFTNPTAATRNSVATALAAYAPIAPYVGRGAGGSDGYIDYVNQIIDRTKEPTFVNFDSLANQAVSTAVNSNWARVVGGPDTVSWSVTGGTAQVANDATGTGATVAATSGTVARGKWIRINTTTSSSGSTTVSPVLTINGFAYTWNVTTQSVLSFATVDNQATAFSTMPTPSPSETGLKRILIGCRFKHDNPPASGAHVFSDNVQTLRLDLATATTYAFQCISGEVVHKSTLAPATGWETHLMAVDLTQTSAAAVSKWFADQGSGFGNVAQASGSSIDVAGTASKTSAQLIATSLGLFGKPSGLNLIDGEMAFFWMHWGDATFAIPDISSPSVQNLFTADRINLTDGSGVLGFKPKLFFYASNGATGWNAGLANKGTEALTMTKGAGTYA